MRVDIGDKASFSEIFYKTTNQMAPIENLNGLAIDSRKIKKGDIFIALKGENFDGHDFIDDCLEKGASFIINEKHDNGNIVKVKSSKFAIKNMAISYRKNMQCKVIGITGSNGKTTTKEILSHILSTSYNISYTKDNYNSTIGLPISIFSISKSDEIFLAEMGTNKEGEIEYLCEVAQPNIGIITNIAEAHIENFDSLDNIYNEKINLYKSISNDGVIFVNMDDTFLSSSKSLFNCELIEYGFSGDYNYTGKFFEIENKLIINNNKKQNAYLCISNSYLTNQLAKNILCSYSVASELGISSKICEKRLNTFSLPEGRGNIISTDRYTIINDTYNSNYSSTISGIYSLRKFTNSRKIIVIADMLELGDKAKEFHIKLLHHLIKNDINDVFMYGHLMSYLYKYALDKMNANIFHFINQEELIKKLNTYLRENDVIYVKGSRGMKMENIIKGIC